MGNGSHLGTRGQVETETDDRLHREECSQRGVVSFGFDLTPLGAPYFPAERRLVVVCDAFHVRRSARSASGEFVGADAPSWSWELTAWQALQTRTSPGWNVSQ